MMRLFWLIFLMGAYLWILTSGNDQFVYDRGKAVYETIAKWIEDADVDFQMKNTKAKKRSRRWD